MAQRRDTTAWSTSNQQASCNNQYAVQVGNQILNFNLNQQTTIGYAKHDVPTQSGMYAPQGGYYGKECYGMSSAHQGSEITAPASYNIPNGYSISSNGNQNVQAIQPAAALLQQMASSVATTGSQTNTEPQHFFAQITHKPSQLDHHTDYGSQANVTHPLQLQCPTENHTQANVTQYPPQQNCNTQTSFKHLSQDNVTQGPPQQPVMQYIPVQMFVVQNNPQQNLNTAVIPSNDLQLSQPQVNFNMTVSNTTSYPAVTTALLQPSSNQQLLSTTVNNVSQNHTSNSTDAGQIQQNAQWDNMMRNGHAVQTTHNSANGHNHVQASTAPLDISQWNVNGQTLKGKSTTVPQAATNSHPCTNSISVGFNAYGVPPPPYPGRAQPQLPQSENMHTSMSDANSSTTRTQARLPTYSVRKQQRCRSSSRHTIHYKASQNSLFSSNEFSVPEQTYSRYHQPNKSNTMLETQTQQPTLPNTTGNVNNVNGDRTRNGGKDKITEEQHPFLFNLLVNGKDANINMTCHKDTVSLLPNTVCNSPKRSRAVAVVPPISQHPTHGNNASSSDASSLPKIKEVWSLAGEKSTDGDSNDSSLTAPSSKEPEPANDSPPTNAAAPEAPSHEQPSVRPTEDSQSHLRFSLGTVRKLVSLLDTRQILLIKNKTQDVERTIPVLDFYWGGNYHKYMEAKKTLNRILKKADKFAKKEDTDQFYGMKTAIVHQLMSMHNWTTSDINMEISKSSWRNVSDESLDIDMVLADSDFLKENLPSVLEKMEKEGACLNNTQAEKETAGVQTNNPSEGILDVPLNQSLNTIKELINNCMGALMDCRRDLAKSHFPSVLENTEEKDLIINNQAEGEKNDNVHIENNTNESSKDSGKMCNNSQEFEDLKPLEAVNYESVDGTTMTATEINISSPSVLAAEQLQRSDSQCPDSPDKSMLSMKITVLTAEEASCLADLKPLEAVNSESVDGTTMTATEINISSPSVLAAEQFQRSDSQCPDSPDKSMLSMKITVLTAEEASCLSDLFADQSSPICLEKSDSSDVELVHSPPSAETVCQVQSPVELPVLDREEKATFIPPVHKTAQPNEMNVKGKKLEHANLAQVMKEGNCDEDKKTEKHPPKHQKDLLKENGSSSKTACPPKCQVRTGGRNLLVIMRRNIPPGLETPSSNVSCSGVKSSSPISPSAALKRKAIDGPKEPSSTETEEKHGAERPRGSLEKASNSIACSSIQPPPSKACKMESPKHSDSSTNCTQPSPPVYPPLSSARDKVMQSWEDRLVSPSRVTTHFDSVKDKSKQEQSCGKKDHSKHKMNFKNRSLSLNELRRKAETQGKSKMSPQEKTSMMLSLLRHFNRKR